MAARPKLTLVYAKMRALAEPARMTAAQAGLELNEVWTWDVYGAPWAANKAKIPTINQQIPVLIVENGGKKTEIGRFKGLGEMMASQLKETTMDPKKRTLARITVPDAETSIEDLVERLMGKRADARFQFIQENAQFVKEELDV